MNRALSPDERVTLLLTQMTLEEKVDMVHGEYGPYGFYNAPIPRLGIPALTMADGPAGIRIGRPEVNEGKATALPATIALAATWDLAAAQQYGDLLGREAWATGHNVVLGPGMDIARVPMYGRLFESFGEDPRLSGQMAVRYIQGIQHHPVVATAKHYNLNTQEVNRFGVDAQLDERTLQEIYTLPFEMAVKDGHVGAAMGAFNKVNGVYCCENRPLLTGILKQQLGFQGWVMSDYGAAPSTVGAANAGLDQEMAGPQFFAERLVEAIHAGQVSLATLDDKVRRILRSMFAFGLFDHPAQISSLPVREDGQFAREIASKAIVLLKNADGLLPLSSQQVRSVVVIGADAANSISGGGSSLVQPTYRVTVLEGIRLRADKGVRVEHAEGTDPVSAADLLPGPPLVPSSVLTPAGSGSVPQVHGLRAEYWTNTRFAGEPRLVRIDRQVGLLLGFFNFGGLTASSLPPTLTDLNNAMSVRWTGSITVPATGEYTLSLTHLGTVRLLLDGQVLIDDPGITLGIQSVAVHLVAGQPHALQIEYAADRPEQAIPGTQEGYTSSGLIGAQIRFGWHEAARREPMVDLRLLGNGLFRTATLVSLFSSAGFLGVLFVGPLFLQEGLGVSPLTSGLTTFPEALGVVTSTQIVAWLYPRVGPRRLMAAGLTGVAVVMALMSLLGRDTNLWFMRLLMLLTGAGMAYAFVPGQTAAFATISSAATGHASALSNALRQLGSALGVAVLGEVLSIVGPTRLSVTGAVEPNLTAYHAAFLAAALLALIAAGIALAISDRDAAPTMRPQIRQTAHEAAPEQPLRVEAGS